MDSLTAADCRDRIVEHLQGQGWVPIALLAAWITETLGLSPGQGRHDLDALVRAGRLERRPTRTSGGPRACEYRVAP